MNILLVWLCWTKHQICFGSNKIDFVFFIVQVPLWQRPRFLVSHKTKAPNSLVSPIDNDVPSKQSSLHLLWFHLPYHFIFVSCRFWLRVHLFLIGESFPAEESLDDCQVLFPKPRENCFPFLWRWFCYLQSHFRVCSVCWVSLLSSICLLDVLMLSYSTHFTIHFQNSVGICTYVGFWRLFRMAFIRLLDRVQMFPVGWWRVEQQLTAV